LHKRDILLQPRNFHRFLSSFYLEFSNNSYPSVLFLLSFPLLIFFCFLFFFSCYFLFGPPLCCPDHMCIFWNIVWESFPRLISLARMSFFSYFLTSYLVLVVTILFTFFNDVSPVSPWSFLFIYDSSLFSLLYFPPYAFQRGRCIL